MRAESALDCLSPGALEAELVERMGRNPFEGTPGQWIEGYVVRVEGRFEVELFERDENGKTIGTRKFTEQSDSCRALDDAIELAIALIIDPYARLAQRSSARQRGTHAQLAEQQYAERPAAAPQAAPGRTAPAVPSSVVRVAPAPTVRLHVARTQVQSGATGDAKLSTAGVLIDGLLKNAAPGIEMDARFGAGSGALRLGMMLVPEQRSGSDLGDFGFGATLFNLSGCSRLTTSRVEWLNCLELGAGAIHVTVHRPAPLEPGDRFMGFAGVETGVSVQILGPIWLDARLFGLAPVGRWDFRLIEVKNDQSRSRGIFVQDRFMPGAAVGLSVRIF